MRINSLVVSRFRNIDFLKFSPGKNFNLIYGLNGQGKTNLLESIYILGSSRSFRNVKLHDLIKYDSQISRIQGTIESVNTKNTIRLDIEQNGKKVEIDNKKIQRASQLYGLFNLIIFSPDDTDMIRLGPDMRRKYLDRAIYVTNITYLQHWNDYYRILKQRNHLLKIKQKDDLDIWTEKIARSGAELIRYRYIFVKQLNEVINHYYSDISGTIEKAEIEYLSEIKNCSDLEGLYKQLYFLLQKHQLNDLRYGTTTVGPHRDDLQFWLDQKKLKISGSQGQKKSYILALKMAEIDNINNIFNENPVLLLDDINSELDQQRKEKLMSFLLKRNLQVFITTTEKIDINQSDVEKWAVFHMENGNLTFEGNGSNG